jgi:dCMP deaminase
LKKVVVISYIPAIHQGYITFLKAHPGNLYVLGREFVLEMPRMERDIRAVDATEVASMLRSLEIMDKVEVLSGDKQLAELVDFQIVMPDEEVNRAFVDTHLAGQKVEFIPTFLRWDKRITTAEFEVPPHRKITSTKLDKELMGKAEAEAIRSPDWWRQVGGVLSRDGKALLVGHNRPVPNDDYTLNVFGDPRSNFDAGERIELSKFLHAEAGLIAEAAKRGLVLEGAAMYVTTFPCPVCAKSIAAAGIKHVYYHQGYSLLDAEDILTGQGVELILVDMKSSPSA